MKKVYNIISFLILLLGVTYGFASTARTSYQSSMPEFEPDQQAPVKQSTQSQISDDDRPLKYPVKKQEINTYDDLYKQHPIDLRDPDNIKTSIEYDAVNGYYIMRTKVGEFEISTPYSMTPEEYNIYSTKKSMQDYWRERNLKGETSNEDKFSITDMKFSLGPADKIFGPGGVKVKTQGSVELIFGFKSQYTDNPTMPARVRRTNTPNFEQKIQMNVTGTVGDKINFGLNYNTGASFDFDQSLAKLSYKGKEDDIIQLIEAGNVSMTLSSSLITGSSALFGIKTDLQFGKLKVSSVFSQQESQSQTISSKGGAQMTEFEVKADNYDENRHFFLGHYFRDTYETAMSTLPYVSSGITINRIEVWKTNKQGNYDDARNIVAFMDLGESSRIDNSHWIGSGSFPANNSNSLYSEIINQPNIRDIQQVNSILYSEYSGYGINGGEDYEKIENARLLSPSDYTLNESLGFISLKSKLEADEVLAVAYEYTVGGKTYQVGEFSTDNVKAPNSLILKLLKSTSQSPQLSSWDLMMKNVYSIGAISVQEDNFEMNIMYRNDSVGTELQYIQEGDIANQLLLRVMNLDRLDTKKAANPDGKFDFINGYTILTSNGRIIFPILEPFGSHLRKKINNNLIADRYVFEELYDSTLVVAQELSEKNKFSLVGKYKGSGSSSVISLNATNIPRGSVVVTAGGKTLVENVDYTVDYYMGTVKILNQSLVESNTSINVSLESQSMYSMQRKSLYGTHLEYVFNKDFSLGGTIMHLSEMPLTTKVNTGSEPISNTIWGLNTSWRKESQWLTNVVDKLPFVDATQPSSIALNAEFAQLIPGHSSVITEAGLAYIDDFESTQINIDIHYPYYWSLASTPYSPSGGLFPEASKSNDVEYGKNRALLAWYAVDQTLNNDTKRTPSNLRGNTESQSNHYTRQVRGTEIFPNRDINASLGNSLITLMNLSYYPKERGPYNLDVEGINDDGTLSNPEDRWGGIMRKIDNSDFETSNIEYIEFWMLDPFVYSDENNPGGDLYFNLGDISEDILKDGKKAFEHGLPIDDSSTQYETTVWGRVPTLQSTIVAFDNTANARAKQDVGLNGLSTADEYNFPTYKDYLERLRAKLSPATIAEMENNPHSPLNDPSGDNYHYYLGDDYDQQNLSILQRYKYYNGTEGNSPDAGETNSEYSTSATSLPDIEDINSDNTLNEYERYYQYKVQLRPGMMRVGTNYITDVVEAEVALKKGTTDKVKWYQFKIPIKEKENYEAIGGIRNFKSIRFIRMFLTGFKQETHLRFATLDLVRGEWRTYTKQIGSVAATNSSINVLAVNIEENGRKQPVNYVLPPGISRETDPSQSQVLQQNEQAMVLRVTNLSPNESRAVYKSTSYDMRNYKRLNMFVHAEAMLDAAAAAQNLKDNELACFIRIGSDMVSNYYEYEIPLVITPEGVYSNNSLSARQEVWKPENMFDFPFSVLADAKIERNRAYQASGASIVTPYVTYDPDKLNNKITVVGNPTISNVENIMIGIRNNSTELKSGEIWVNELRMSEFDQDGGWAALGNLALNLSDLGSFNVSGRMETAGFGGLESNVSNRNMETNYQINLSAGLDLGRFVPKMLKLQMPAYYTYTNETNSPKYNPLDEDILFSEALASLDTKQEKDSLRSLSQSVVETKSFSITNAKINIKSKIPMPYDPANVTVTYSTNESNEHTPEIEQNFSKQQRVLLNYAYNFSSEPWEPFKENKSLDKPTTKLIKDFNIYYLPTSINYSSNMNRVYSHVRLRDLISTNGSASPVSNNLSFSKDFMWNRQFDFKYQLTRGLSFGIQTAMNSNIEESYYTPEIGQEYYEAWRDTVWNSIKRMGTPYTYQQVFGATWKLPIDKLPYLDWVTANTDYNSTYTWNRSATLESGVDIGNVAASVGRFTFNADLKLESLFKKSKHLKSVIERGQKSTRQQVFRPRTFKQIVSLRQGDTLTVKHGLNSEVLTVNVRDSLDRPIQVKYKTIDGTSIRLNPTFSAEKVSITVITKDPNVRTFSQQLTDFAVLLPLSLRSVSVKYNTSSSLTVPGFIPEPGFLGQKDVNGVFAPGWAFVFGYHDSNTLATLANNNWLYMGQDIVNPANEAYTSDLDIRASLEPISGLKIELTARRQEQSNSVIRYMDEGMPSTFNGNFNTTIITLKTAFEKTGSATTDYYSAAFQQFLSNREVIQQRLQNQYIGTRYPSTGFFADDPSYRGKEFNPVNGTFNINSPDVLIPAFLAAYTGRDVNTIGTNPFLSILEILPNWSINYNGLSNFTWFKEKFKSVSLTHAYSNKYSVGNYSSYSTWVSNGDNSTLGYIRDVQTEAPIPSMAYDISTVSINESFSPLLGVNLAMKNSTTAKLEYKKQRTLALNLTSTQLVESLTDEFVIGAGYVVNDFDVILKLKSSKQQTVKNDLKLNLDFSYKDIKALLRKINEIDDLTQATSGNKVISLKFTANYVFSSKVNLQLFFDRQMTAPLVSSSYPVSSTNVGISFKFMLMK